MIINIAAYKFARMTGLKELRPKLLARCKELELKGTILLAPEGINLFIAGSATSIDAILKELRSLPGLEQLSPKFSESADQPFSRMLVRLKKEIIAFGDDRVDPATYTSPRLEAKELKAWLDAGKPVVLFDTRNDYEVKLGTFHNAIPAGIDHFRNFPEAVARLPDHLKSAPIVTFCTGGIRCEKAAPFMEMAGFQEVYQLEGGILKYFEEVGSDHYDGECFVFDQRVGVDPALRETDSVICFHCQTPLSPDEQADPRFVLNVSCPYCFLTDEQQQALALRTLQERIAAVCHPLPGSVPADNRRPIRIPGDYDGKPLIDVLNGILGHVPDEKWRQLINQGRVLNPDGSPAKAEDTVRSGEQYTRLFPAEIEPDVNPDIHVLFLDSALMVLDKPAPLPLHPCGRFNRNTLQNILHLACYPEHPRPAHRLDSNTTGLVVCARSRHFAKLLHPQFAKGEVEKHYLVRVATHPKDDTFTIDAPISAEAGKLGSREVDDESGLPARTEFTVLKRYPDGTALLEARPITGRTNQIRIHLWQAGFPILGDPAYLANEALGDTMTLPTSAPPMCLHAHRIAFSHPISGKRLEFTAPPPDWAS